VGLVGAHAIEVGAVHGRMAHALPASRQFALTAVPFGNVQDGWVAAQLNQQAYILHTHDGGRSWTRYRVPTLVIAGRYDEATPAIAETVHRGIAGSTSVLFEHSSHMPHAEEPTRFIQVLDDFLTGVEATTES
jgi:pimeloyl-ACP methyl ester carboxylesterase